jgi:hypothetical protein
MKKLILAATACLSFAALAQGAAVPATPEKKVEAKVGEVKAEAKKIEQKKDEATKELKHQGTVAAAAGEQKVEAAKGEIKAQAGAAAAAGEQKAQAIAGEVKAEVKKDAKELKGLKKEIKNDPAAAVK